MKRISAKVNSLIGGIKSTTYAVFPKGDGYFGKDTQDAYDKIIANNKVNPNGRIVIYGYSYGGKYATFLAKKLKNSGIRVELLATVDAAAGWGSGTVDRLISDNVKLNVNFYERHPSGILRSYGDFNSAESTNTTKILNFDDCD